jgi:murein DD-endopeptidase MepM/ murein hydrolase activator NlpD
MAPLMALGNSVVIEHPGPVFSLYAHLKTGSVKVKAGAKVKKGTVVGLCGNSGNTSEPHLHFQLQDGPLVDHSWGVEPVFHDVPVTRGGNAAVMKDYTWLKGDLVGKP